MAQAKRRYFIVSGRGSFPFDMLRYDSCWPYGSEDASNLDVSRDTREEYSRIRHVLLCTDSPHQTPARWSSFGWGMSDVTSHPPERPKWGDK